MTAKELGDYEEGKAYGYRNYRKTILWPKSDAWCAGVKAGQAEGWRDHKKAEAQRRREQKKKPRPRRMSWAEWHKRREYLRKKEEKEHRWEGTDWYE